MFENWKLSKLGVVHMFYGQIGGVENVSGIIFSIWPNPGSKNREKKFKNCHFSKIQFFFKQRMYMAICLHSISTGSYLAVPRTSMLIKVIN